MTLEYVTEEAAKKVLDTLEPEYEFCPLINKTCTPFCVCHQEAWIVKHMNKDKWLVNNNCCNNQMFFRECCSN